MPPSLTHTFGKSTDDQTPCIRRQNCAKSSEDDQQKSDACHGDLPSSVSVSAWIAGSILVAWVVAWAATAVFRRRRR